jgi:glycine/D-amino acid oxidase-like deaminating enzyme
MGAIHMNLTSPHAFWLIRNGLGRCDARVPAKVNALIDKARRLFPQPAYGWAGTFGETEHGLAYIGAHPGGGPRVHYALGCRGNGIAYSGTAAKVLNAAALGKPHRYRDTFAFDR